MPAPKALVVEDEPLVAMHLENLLTQAGIVVAHSVGRLAAGVSVARDGDIDLALLDVRLSGGETSFAIAEQLLRRSVPFAFVTSEPVGVLDGRFCDVPVVPKPFHPEQILAAVDTLLGR